jgi:signal transduction histidine kinase
MVSVLSWLALSSIDAFELLLEYLETHEDYELDEILLLIIIIGFLSIFFTFRRVREASRINKQLEDINKNLRTEVEYQISQRHKKEQLLIQQSKLASLGEMIGNIAHQWRQPLNALGLVVQNIYFSYKMDELDDALMDKSVKKVNLLTQNMSDTIDDFRNFFKPDKEIEEFNLNTLVKDTLALVEATFEHHNIEIKGFKDGEVLVCGFRNEFSQTLLNVLNNSKDAFFDNKIENSIVNIEIGVENNYGFVKIEDNAGGISPDILDKVFDPYFTTKEEGKGTGIGLYMAKIIIEQNMNGKIEVENINNGATFIIKVPLSKDIS